MLKRNDESPSMELKSRGNRDVVLINMPFASAWRPSLSLGLFESSLHSVGISCQTLNLNLQFAHLCGLADYNFISDELSTSSLVGEWLFSSEVFGEDACDKETYEQFLHATLHTRFDRSRVSRILSRIRGQLEQFMAASVNQVLQYQPRVVALTSSYHQTLASVAITRRLKTYLSDTIFVIGGANCEGEMGYGLLSAFPEFDYVCLGEGDRSFIPWLDSVLEGHTPHRVMNIVSGAWLPESSEDRHALIAEATAGSTIRSRADLDRLPIPNFDAFQAELEIRDTTIVAQVPIEFSRGCWWGAKHHCTFCGLNGNSLAFASKSPERAISEITLLSRRYGNWIMLVDNILDIEYIRTVLPEIARDLDLNIFVETKVNLRREQISMLKSAGVRTIQPGIESLSSNVLRIMRKGTTLLQNVQTLKWCREYGISVSWNILTGFEGEMEEDYLGMEATIPKITHLSPPMWIGPVRIDRFSPMFSAPEAFGYSSLEPHPSYAVVFKVENTLLSQIAYYFTSARIPDTCFEAASRLETHVEQWRRESRGALLTVESTSDGPVVRDTRSARDSRLSLNACQWELLRLTDEISSLDAALERAVEITGQSAASVESDWKWLESHALVTSEGRKVLSLVTNVPA
jgi:ribosomal peptide maturation radical SAM protein 1